MPKRERNLLALWAVVSIAAGGRQATSRQGKDNPRPAARHQRKKLQEQAVHRGATTSGQGGCTTMEERAKSAAAGYTFESS